MRTSTDRILVSHTGTLPLPDEIQRLREGLPGSYAELRAALPDAVAQVVAEQVDLGVDIVNDGEFPKHSSFEDYTRDRLGGFERRPPATPPTTPPGPVRSGSMGPKDRKEFFDYWDSGLGVAYNPVAQRILLSGGGPTVVTGPVTYAGAEVLAADIANVKSAADARGVEAVLCSTHPHGGAGVRNEYYPDDEALLVAIADALHEEYAAIAGAGVVVQIDNPQLAVRAQDFETADEYRRAMAPRVELLNYALRGVDPQMVRMHTCFGANKGPHVHDVDLPDLLEVLFGVNVGCYNIEQSNPRHAHEYHVFEEIHLPEGKAIMPGLVTTACDIVEHPELIAERIVNFADRIGRENVIAGTDCGLGARVGHPSICWAKLRALAEGAEIATKRLWRS